MTGAGSGIGEATTLELRQRGARVIGVDRTQTPVADEHFPCDLTIGTEIDRLLEELPAGAHGLCNIAGVSPAQPGSIVLRTNFMALRRLTIGMIPKLESGSSIVNLASMAGNGWRDNLEQVVELISTEWDALDDFVIRHGLESASRSYHLSKEAVIVWTMQSRWAWRERGIRMNCVSPGPVDTPILPEFLEMLGERAQESVRNMDRFGLPEDIAPTVAFLLSDEAAWYRGANLSPDGGMGAHLALKRHGL